MDSKKVLLVIDMQKGSFTPETPRYDTKGVVDRINALAHKFRVLGFAIIFIQHDGSLLNEFVPQSREWELLDELAVTTTDTVISKSANDSFYRSQLLTELDKLGAKELFITGCATDFCVAATVQSALTKDYRVTVIGDTHTTAERPNLTAKAVIDHYNWVWRNMIPTKGSIQVLDFQEICDRL